MTDLLTATPSELVRSIAHITEDSVRYGTPSLDEAPPPAATPPVEPPEKIDHLPPDMTVLIMWWRKSQTNPDSMLFTPYWLPGLFTGAEATEIDEHYYPKGYRFAFIPVPKDMFLNMLQDQEKETNDDEG